MALQTATNPETGERVALVDGQWVPITQTATNPETGARIGLINNQWMPLPLSAGLGRQAQEQPEEEGFFGGLAKSVVQGTKSTAGSLYAAGATALDERGAVVESAQAAQKRAKDTPQAQKKFEEDIAARKEISDDGLWAGIKNVVGATVDNPEGALQMVISQLPNTAAALASGYTGFKVGAAAGTAVAPGPGTVVGGTVGFLTGLFAANTALELGGKAQEKASDGDFTEAERYAAMSEGIKKGATITAVDAATFGASKWLMGTTRRAMETATVRTIENAGLDAAKITKSIKEAQAQALAATAKQGKEASTAAVEKATVEAMAREGLTDPVLIKSIREAQAKAVNGLNTLGKKAARGGTALSLETVGEGLGEYLGEYAATGEASATDAVLEGLAGLSMSLGELRAAAKLDKAGVLTGATMAKAEKAPPAPDTTETPQVNPEDVAAAEEYIASITGPDDTNDASSEFHAEKLGIPLPAKDENYLENLNAAIAARVQELKTPATTTTPAAPTDREAAIEQRTEQIMTLTRAPYEMARATAIRQLDEEAQNAQVQAGQPAGDGGVPATADTGRPAVGEGVSVPQQPAPIQPITPQVTEAQPTGMVPDGTDATSVAGGTAGESASLGDIANQTAALVTEELMSTTEPAVQGAAPTADIIDLADQRDLRTDEEGLGDLQQAVAAESAPLIQKYSFVLQGLAPLMNRFAKEVEVLASLGGTGTSLRAKAAERIIRDFNDAVDALEKVRNGEMLPEVAIKQYLEPLLNSEAMAEFEDIASSLEAEVTEATGRKPAGEVVPIAKAEPTVEEQVVADEAMLASDEAQAILSAPEVEVEEQVKSKRGGARKGAGRKPADLTPEEREAKAEATKASKADLTALKREVDRAETSMNEVMDTTGLEGVTGAELEREVSTRKEKLQQAVDILYRLHQRNKGRTQGRRARDLLKNENIPPSVLAEAKRRFEDVGEVAADRGMDVSSAGSTNDTRQTVVGPVNDAIAKAKNAQQLLTIIAKHNIFFRLLAGRLRSFVAGVDVVVIETDSVLPAQLLRHIDSWNYADGSVRATGLMVSTKDNKRTIYLRGSSFGKNQGVNVVTALHEVLHAALDRKIKTGMNAFEKGLAVDKATEKFMMDLYTLMAVAKSKYEKLKAIGLVPAGVVARVESSKRLDAEGNEIYGVFEDPYEFLAHGLTEAPMQSFLKAITFADSRTAFSRFIAAIRNVLGLPVGQTNALEALVNVADTALRARQTKEMQAAFVKEFGKKDAASAQKGIDEQKKLDKKSAINSGKLKKTKTGKAAAKLGAQLQLLRDPRKNAFALAMMGRNLKNKMRQFVFRVAYTNDALAEAAKADGLPSVADAINEIQNMQGMTGQMLEGAQEVISAVYRAMRKDATLKDKLDDIVHRATLERVDPAKNKSNKDLNKMWDDLGADGQRAYILLRDYYKANMDMYMALLDKQITDADITQEQKEKLLAGIRARFEGQSKIEPYFPLARYGKYWVSIGQGKGDAKREFYMFESYVEQQALLKAYADKKGKTVDELKKDNILGAGEGTDSMRSSLISSGTELRQMFSEIDKIDFKDLDEAGATEAREKLKNAVYQMYLAGMPQQNLRKQFINRKDIIGFDTDTLRNFAKTASGQAYQLSRLAYLPKISRLAKAAEMNSKNNELLTAYSKELNERVRLEMEGVDDRDSLLSKLATYANRAAYLHFLSGASSALLQPMQLLTAGFNVLGARHGYVAATRELMRTFKVWNEFGIFKKNADGSITMAPPSIRYSKSMDVNAEERRALFDMLGTGVADITMNNELVSRKTMPTEKFDTKIETAKRWAFVATMGLMHTTERLSREVMLLTSYRLSRQKGMSIEDAKRQAIADTYEGVGNMSSSNRPPIMRNPLGKVSLQFMMFPLYMTTFLLKNFKRMIVPMNGQGRAEATKMFLGTMAATWVLAGAAGLPAFSMVTGLIGWMVNGLGDDDDEDMKTIKELGFETWVRKVWLPSMVGQETIGGYSVADIIERGPANIVTGIDFSSRLSLNDMFVRDRKETRTTKEGLIEMGMGATGPFGAQIMSYADAYDAFMQGDYQKGIEKASPALIRNLALASKFAREGAKDFRGAELIARSDYTTGMMIAQIIGFRSDKLANMQKLGFELTAIEQKINFKRSEIMNIANRVFMKENDADIDDVMDKIIKFNSQYPAYAITMDNLIDSLMKRAEQRGMSKSGVILSEKNLSIPGFAEALQTVED